MCCVSGGGPYDRYSHSPCFVSFFFFLYRNELDIPVTLRSIILEEDIPEEEQEERPLLESLRDARKAELALLDDDELVKELRNTKAKLKADPPKINLRVTDGSYTVNKVIQEGGRIDTVLNQSPIFRVRKTIQEMITTRDVDVRAKKEKKVIMDGVNLNFDSGKIYLVLGAPGSGKVSLFIIQFWFWAR